MSLNSGLNVWIALQRRLIVILKGENDENLSEWRVLVYDPKTRDMLSPIFKLGDLRKMSITLHLLLKSDRGPIPDAPSLYLLVPSRDNIERAAADCRASLYKSFQFHFFGHLSSENLRLLAQLLAPAPPSVHVSLYEHPAPFLTPQPDFFSLGLDRQFASLFSSHADDAMVSQLADTIASGLTSVLTALQTLPVIVSTRGGPAELVATRLRTTLHDALQSRTLSPPVGAPRPLLLLFDRSADIPTALLHPWTYRALLHDVLGAALNLVTVPPALQGKDTNTSGHPQHFELEPYGGPDGFLTNTGGRDFDVATAALADEIERYQRATQRLAQGPRGAGSGDAGPDAAGLMEEVKEEAKRKRYLDTHAALLGALARHIDRTRLDILRVLEEALVHGRDYDRGLLASILKGTHKETARTPWDDKLRLAAIYVWMRGRDALIEDFLRVARAEAAEDVAMRIEAVIRRVAHDRLMMASDVSGNTAQCTSGPGGQVPGAELSDWLRRVGRHVVDGLRRRETLSLLPLTRLVAELIAPDRADNRVALPLDAYDPRTRSSVSLTQLRMASCIAFVVGGGNYLEYQNLREWDESRGPAGGKVRLVYGTTDIVTASEFLDQVR